MQQVNSSSILGNNIEELSSEEIKNRALLLADACNQWTLDVHRFRELLVKEGPALLLEEFDIVDKKLNDRIEHIKTGKSNATTEADSTKSVLGLIALGVIVLIPWFIGVKSFFI